MSAPKKMISVTAKVNLTTKDAITVTLKIISATTQVILATNKLILVTEEVMIATLNVSQPLQKRPWPLTILCQPLKK